MIYLEKKDPAKNMSRYYRLFITPTLFGSHALVKEYGRINSKGRRIEIWYPDKEEAKKEYADTIKRKMGKGYYLKVSLNIT